MVQYNFLGNVYENVEPPTIKKNTLLSGSLYDIDTEDWGYVGDNGIIYANNNLPQQEESSFEESRFTINNNPEYQPQFSINNSEYETQFSIPTSGRPRQAYEFFKYRLINDKKFDEATADRAARAIVGNFMFESGDSTLNNTSKIGDKKLGPKGSSYGMGQWRENRRDALINFAAKRGKPISDFDTQLEFAWDEMNASQKSFKIIEGLKNSKTIEEATESFMKTFERPSSDPKINKLSERIKYAKTLA